MLLRLILVGVVSAMGLNLPSARDWDEMAARGHAWIQEAIARVDSMMPAGELAFEPAAPEAATPELVQAPTENPDWAFDAIVDQMASTFANPPAPVADVVLPAEATDLLAAATGLPELVAPITPEPTPAPAAVEVIADAKPDTPEATRGSRIDLAIRLTREAMGAWTRVFEPAPQMASMSR
ncbi:hypothetical protein EP7_000646 [Isosphaeraceae bacterium EP7]